MSLSPARIILCPGQGAQFVGMGKAWFEKSPEARAVFERANGILGDRLGSPLSKLCFEGPDDRLNQTDVSQPAIYATSVACWHGLLAGWNAGGGASTNGSNGGVDGGGAIESHVRATAGLSLGEYTALHIAGAFSFEEGLEFVVLRGQAMQEAADAVKLPDGTPGSGMVALIGGTEVEAAFLCKGASDRGSVGSVPPVPKSTDLPGGAGQWHLVPANFNCPGQIVISGSIGACTRAVEIAGETGLRAQPLPVAGAFHSPFMIPARSGWQRP